jgi:hypothetical protein
MIENNLNGRSGEFGRENHAYGELSDWRIWVRLLQKYLC